MSHLERQPPYRDEIQGMLQSICSLLYAIVRKNIIIIGVPLKLPLAFGAPVEARVDVM
jgi:hypothetical protein